MDISHLSIFIEVMQYRSFATVAKRRGTAPSTVSRAIGSLEQSVGVRLFERSTRKMEPTDHAVLLQQSIEPLLEEIQISLTKVKDDALEIAGSLRITSPVSFGLTHLTDMINQFGIEHPKVNIDFLMTDRRVDIIGERIDIAFRFGHLDDSNFISQKLHSLAYIVCASPQYIKGSSRLNNPQDIADHNCLSFLIPGFSSSWKFRKSPTEKIAEYPIAGNLKVSNALALKISAVSGHGIALLPKMLIEQELANGTLINIFPDYETTASSFGSHIWMIYPSKKYLPKRTKLLLSFIRSRLKLYNSY